jgi:hypothetical protein
MADSKRRSRKQADSPVGGLNAKFPGLAVRIDSDKCDWRIASAKELPSKRALRPVADKCDGGELKVRPGMMHFAGANRRFGGIVASDKCEWRLRAVDEIYTADLKTSGRELRVNVGIRKGQRVRFRGVSSDKCDFHLKDIEIYERGDWRPVPGGKAMPPLETRGAEKKPRKKSPKK